QLDGLSVLVLGEARKGFGRVDVVREQEAARSQMRPGGTELEPHALVGVLTVVHERIDRPQTLEQRRQHLLAPPEDERPALLQLGRDQPAGFGHRRDAGAALTLVERPGLIVATELAGEVDRMQVPFAVSLQGKQRERRREAVGHTGLHRDARAELAQTGDGFSLVAIGYTEGVY